MTTDYTTPWPHRRGPFLVTIRFDLREGRMECVGFEVIADDDSVISASDLRAIPLGKLVANARRALAKELPASEPDVPVAVQQEAWEARSRAGRPPRYGPEHFQEVARIYAEAYAQNRTPTRAVARRFRVSESAAAHWVARCREVGLLPPTSRGKARASLRKVIGVRSEMEVGVEAKLIKGPRHGKGQGDGQ